MNTRKLKDNEIRWNFEKLMNNLLENYFSNLFKNFKNEWKERKETVSKSCGSSWKHLKNQRAHVSIAYTMIQSKKEVRSKGKWYRILPRNLEECITLRNQTNKIIRREKSKKNIHAALRNKRATQEFSFKSVIL